jgi:hypothetical protein
VIKELIKSSTTSIKAAMDRITDELNNKGMVINQSFKTNETILKV